MFFSDLCLGPTPVYTTFQAPQPCSRLVVELRGDVEAFGLGELVVGHHLLAAVRQIVGFLQERKFAPLYFLPGWLHVTDGFEHVFVLLAGEFGNLQRGHALWL